MTREELLAKLEAHYRPLVDQHRGDQARAQVQADQVESEWRTKEFAVREHFAAQEAIVEKTVVVNDTKAVVDAIEAMPAPAPKA